MKKILVIGAGSIGERHIRCLQLTKRADVSVCEANDSLRQQIAERYGLTADFASLNEALSQPFDGAVVCTPAHLHVPMAQQLAEAGSSILIEKPLSTSLDGIDPLKSVVQKGTISAGVAYVLRHHPALQKLKQLLQTGSYGPPVQVVYTGGQHFPFYRPAYREIYYTRHETGGGAIQDALTHVVNASEWLVGPVTRLVADAEHCVLDGVTVEDTVHLITRHHAVLGSFSLNQHQPPNESTLTVVCEQGALRFEMHQNRCLTCQEPNAAWVVAEAFELERDDLFVRQASAFIDQLEQQTEPSCSIAEAEQTLRVNLAALESVRTGTWIQL
ncbi:MAG: Gfo/Idh/MocA family oxidoreductase [Fuerstiella sp.]